MKKKIIYIVMLIISFLGGCFVSNTLSRPNNNTSFEVYGTYAIDQKTLSINHDSTYQYAYPFSFGEIEKLDDHTYKFINGDLDNSIAIFSKEDVRVINIQNNFTPKILDKKHSFETRLNDNIVE